MDTVDMKRTFQSTSEVARIIPVRVISSAAPHLGVYFHFLAPGPKYQRKTTLGTIDHCVTYPQAPAYTLREKYQGR